MFKTTLIAAISTLALTVAALGQGSGTPVNVLQYALSHPSDNANMPSPPELGDSVPKSVTLQRAEGGPPNFAYFYYAGKPVIVDIRTRSVVKVGQ